MSNSKDRAIYVGTELLLNIIDRLIAASMLVKQARDEDRDVTVAELALFKENLNTSLANLDQTIEEKSGESGE